MTHLDHYIIRGEIYSAMLTLIAVMFIIADRGWLSLAAFTLGMLVDLKLNSLKKKLP